MGDRMCHDAMDIKFLLNVIGLMAWHGVMGLACKVIPAFFGNFV